MTDPIEINGTQYAPVWTACPACKAEIDAQRAFIEGACPVCHTAARALCASDSGEKPPEDYEPESYKIDA